MNELRLATASLSTAVLLAIALAACGGSAEPEGALPPAEAQAAPEVDAGDDQSASEVAASLPDQPVMAEDAIPGPWWGDSRISPFSPRTGKVHPVPEFVGLASWINSEPLTLGDLRGNVVLVEFWTYSCINCVWNMPYLKDWYDKYTDQGLIIIGIHSPEMRAEKKRENVLAAIAEHGLEYPVAQDNDFATWRAFGTVAWPTLYLVDQGGTIRYSHFGSGGYEETEQKILELLAELGA